MKLDKEKIDQYEFLIINDDMTARVCDKENFKKMMVFYLHKKPVWFHKDCILTQEKSKRASK
jgi:hypothetical protein